MTNYTSLETSKRLYEAFPEWSDTLAWWQWSLPDGEPYIAYPELERRWGLFSTQNAKTGVPAFDSDCLLGKLPWTVVCSGPNKGRFGTWMTGKSHETFCEAATPSEALGLLALKLREGGLL